MRSSLSIQPVTARHDLNEFVRLPWKVYQGDPNWVPPLISDQLATLDPDRGFFYNHADVGLFMARRDGEAVGSIAAFVDHRLLEHTGEKKGGFGFFEVIGDYDVAAALLGAAWDWLRAQGIRSVSGPTDFSDLVRPGVLVEGGDVPPVMLQAYTPLYYQDFLERFGMFKDHDLYAWRADRSRIGEELQGVPEEIFRVAEVAKQRAGVQVRKVNLERWDDEIRVACRLFNATLEHLPENITISEAEFHEFADPLKSFLDTDLALIAEVDGEAVGFCVALPDINRILIHLNGRLFPFGWLKARRLIPKIEVVTFKLMGVLEKYRRRGIDALLYLEVIKAIYANGYAWIDGSVTSENNPMVNLIARRFGAERYKHYRVYKMDL